MQNLPFLATQNLAIQNTLLKSAGVQNTQNSSESSGSFRQVLSEQVEQEASKEHVTQQVKPQKNQKQVSHSQPRQDMAHAAVNKEGLAKSDLVENKDNHSADAVVSSSDPKSGKVAKEQESEDVASANVATQDASGAAIVLLQVPLTTANPSVNVAHATPGDTLAGIDAQIRQQLDMSTKTGLAQDQKIALPEDKSAKSPDNATSDASQQQSEVSTSNSNWLDRVLPQSNKDKEGDESLSKFVTKSVSETSVKSAQDPLAKHKLETMTSQAAAVVSANSFQVLAQASPALVQDASSNVISAYPGKTGWDQAISQKVVWMVGASEQSATLTLNPPDLGPLQVVISVNNDKADTTFISENPEVRQALENGISTLRGLMDQAGVQLGQTNVSTGKQQQDFQQAARERLAATNNTSSQSLEKPVVSHTVIRTNNGLVDTFA